MFDSCMHLLSICIQIIQLTLSKYVYIYTHTTKLLQKKKTPIISSKKLLILMPKFLYIYILKFFKTFQNFCYLNFYTFMTNYQSSTLTYIIFLLFKSQIFFYLLQFLSQSINSNVSLFSTSYGSLSHF